MIPLPLPIKITEKDKNHAIFEIEGLYPGYGATIGNSLRRVLLSSLSGVAVTEVRIKGAPHEFSTMSGILEDTIVILLNLKNLRFKIHEGDFQKIQLKVKGEKKVKGSDFKIPSQVKLSNPEAHIATITDKKIELEIEILIEKGIGYEQKDHRKARRGIASLQEKTEIGTIFLDAIYTPIKNVKIEVENMRVGDRTDFDKLNLEIETDGTITPEMAFFEACDILMKHFNIISEVKASPKSNQDSGKKTKEVSDSSKISVEDLKLSARSLNTLVQNNIKTVGGILKKSEESLLEMEGMGEKAISEIKKKIKKLGLEIKSKK